MLTFLALVLIKIEKNDLEDDVNSNKKTIKHPEDSESNQGSESNHVTEPELSLYDLVKDRRYWLLYLMNFCTFFYGYTILGSYKILGAQYIHDDMFLTCVGSVGFVLGSLRFLWSLLLDNGFSF